MPFIDSVSRKSLKISSQKSRRKFSYLLMALIVLVIILINFFYFSKITANFLLDNIEPITLFRNGKYLVLFQNNAELRSSGGFIGSYAVAETENSEIKNLFFNTNIYALDNLFAKENFVQAPAPIAKMTKGQTWALRDANFDASFSEAAKDILYFYQRETGDQVDGIIALNAAVMIDLLKLTGPINLEKYDLTVTAENFYFETQYKVEKEYFKNPENWVINEPKTFLADLYPEILKRALDDKLALATLIKKELASKEIIFYFQNSERQAIAEKQNWAGKIPNERELKDIFQTANSVDYLYVNNNSFSGNKSSINIKESLDYKVSPSTNDRLQAKLKISRVHAGSNQWPDGPNRNWTRIFIPKGSTFLEAKLNEFNVSSTLEIGEEGDKAYFGLEIITSPGQANILELSYLLPFKSTDYHLLVQKQPGVKGTDLRVSYEDSVLFDRVLDGDNILNFP